jgi:glycosyltransferase involved in cell wall biosynthesis
VNETPGVGRSGDTKPRDIRVSVVVPFFNTGRNMVEELHRLLGDAATKLPGGVELMYVDDGSTDETLETLRSVQQRDARVVVVELAANFGQHAAFSAGFDRVRGRFVVTMDADLQCDPEEIPLLLEPLERGCDFVSGVRKDRRDPFVRQVLSRVLARMVTSMTGVRLRDVGCPFNACTLEVAHAVSAFGELRRFLKPLAVRVAKRVEEVEVAHRARHHHRPRSSYSATGLVRLFMDFLVNTIGDVFGWLFLISSGIAVVLNIAGWVALARFNTLGIAPGVMLMGASIMAGLVALLGLAGDYVQRIYRQSSGRPFYLVRRVYAATAIEEHA